MPLVDYSDSDSSQDGCDSQEAKTAAKQPFAGTDHDTPTMPNTLPSLPAEFHDLYASQVRSSIRDDPSLHGGRKRQTPHIQGAWNTHVYIEWLPDTQDLARLESCLAKVVSLHPIDTVTDHIHSLLRSDLGVALPLHISLSSPMSLLTEELDNFFGDVKSRVTAQCSTSFILKTSTLAWTPNNDKTRWFLVMRIDEAQRDNLKDLLVATNTVARAFGKPALYDAPLTAGPEGDASRDPSQHCHLSIAWSLTAPPVDQRSFSASEFEPSEVCVTSIKVKMGNTVQSVSLEGG